MPGIALPRDIASAVVVRGFATAQRAIVVVAMLLTVVPVTVTVLDRGGSVPHLLVAVACLLVTAGLALQLLLAPSVGRAVLFLVGGSVVSSVYAVALLRSGADLTEPAPFLVNRIAVALLMVGALSASARVGLVWTVLGFAAGELSLIVGFALAGEAAPTGVAPFLALAVVLAVYGAFEIGGRRLRSQLADIGALQSELAEVEHQRELERRASRIVHDTVLADLAIVAARSGPVDGAARARLERDVAAAAAGTVALRGAGAAPARSRVGDELLDLARDYQWSGVRIDISGFDALDAEVDDDVREAVIGATRAALDNVVRHAGADRAEVVVGVRDGTLSVLVVDDGIGFAADDVDPDRLGVRSSIDERVRRVGGAVRVWSGDEGTTVMLTVPARTGAS
ncbi:sensor histidine kinase [Microcella alkalica]|uniref:sensor histidine kinase n=1 Tax=Microcella alkalica TaxID=355930 RepID=UPI00145D5E08|nr:ATP-binding protein [Microcella alkalica]